MTARIVILLSLVCIVLTGCVAYPVTMQQTESSGLNSPYSGTNVRLENGVLSVQLADPTIKDADFRRIKLVEAILITDAGKEIALKLWATNHGNGVTFLFKPKDSGFSGDRFELRITTSLDGKATTITGRFNVHDVGKWVSWRDLNG